MKSDKIVLVVIGLFVVVGIVIVVKRFRELNRVIAATQPVK